MDDLGDEELLEAWRVGDKAAGATLLHRHHSAVDRFLRNKVNEHDLADLAQRTFLAVLEQPHRYERRQGAVFKTYLLGIAYRVLLKHVRKDAVIRRYEQLEDFSVAELGQTPSQILAMREEQRRVLEVIQRLPLKLQVVIELRFWEGMKQREIAEALGLPMGTVADRIRRGLQLLRKILAEEPHGPSPS